MGGTVTQKPGYIAWETPPPLTVLRARTYYYRRQLYRYPAFDTLEINRNRNTNSLCVSTAASTWPSWWEADFCSAVRFREGRGSELVESRRRTWSGQNCLIPVFFFGVFIFLDACYHRRRCSRVGTMRYVGKAVPRDAIAQGRPCAIKKPTSSKHLIGLSHRVREIAPGPLPTRMRQRAHPQAANQLCLYDLSTPRK